LFRITSIALSLFRVSSLSMGYGNVRIWAQSAISRRRSDLAAVGGAPDYRRTWPAPPPPKRMDTWLKTAGCLSPLLRRALGRRVGWQGDPGVA
jgi:hypothetical protein